MTQPQSHPRASALASVPPSIGLSFISPKRPFLNKSLTYSSTHCFLKPLFQGCSSLCSTFRNSIKRSPWPFTMKQCFESSFSSTPAPFCDGSQDDAPALVTVESHMCTDQPSSQTCSSGRNEGVPEGRRRGCTIPSCC